MIKRQQTRYLCSTAIAASMVLCSCKDPDTKAISEIALDPVAITTPANEPLLTSSSSDVGLTLLIPQQRLKELAIAGIPDHLSSNGRINEELTHYLTRDWYSYDFSRGTPEISFHDNVVHFDVPIGGKVTGGGHFGGWLGFNIQETADIEGNVVGDIKIDVGNEYTLSAVPEFTFNCRKAEMTLSLPLRPKVKVCGIVRDAFNKNVPRIAQSALTDALSRLEIKERVASAWDSLHIVKQVSDSPTTWLVINPKELRMQPLNLSSDPVPLAFGFRAATKILVQPEQPTNDRAGLPGLVFDPNVSGKFLLKIPVASTLGSISDKLNGELAGKEIKIGKSTTVLVKSVSVGTSGKVLVLGLSVEATDPKLRVKAAGTIYTSGILSYDPEKKLLKIEQLDWEVATKNFLVNKAAWLFHDEILATVRDKATINATSFLNEAQMKADQLVKDKLNTVNGPVKLDIKIDSLQLEEFRVENSHAFAFFSATGNANGILQ